MVLFSRGLILSVMLANTMRTSSSSLPTKASLTSILIPYVSRIAFWLSRHGCRPIGKTTLEIARMVTGTAIIPLRSAVSNGTRRMASVLLSTVVCSIKIYTFFTFLKVCRASQVITFSFVTAIKTAPATDIEGT